MKFLKHAVAEVALVVLGILIAFQIDTWNDSRELRIKELQYLVSIRDGLLADMDNIETIIEFNTVKIDTISAILQSFSSGLSNEAVADLLNEQGFILGTFEVLLSNRVAFDNMISAESIELVSDRELRLALSNHYSGVSPLNGTDERVAQVTRRIIDFLTAGLTHSSETPGLFAFNIPGLRHKSEVVLHQNAEFLGTLMLMQVVSEAQNDELNTKKTSITELLQRIGTQLGE